MQHRMRVESLKASSLPLPDLAAFNRRIRERTDPLLDRPWVRRLGYLFAAGFVLFAGVWLYFASGLPSSEKLLAYQPSLPTNVRGYDGTPVQTFARERRVELSYEEYPPMVVQAFISAEDKTFFTHGGLDYPGLIGAVFDFTTRRQPVGGARRAGRPSLSRLRNICSRTAATRSAARRERRSSHSGSNRRSARNRSSRYT